MAETPLTVTKKRIDELQKNLGFDIIKPLQENQRFLVYLIHHENEMRMFKIACQPELEPNLERDVRMSMFLMTLGKGNATTTYRVRNIYTYGKGWFIGEYFEAPILLEQQKELPKDNIMHVARDIWAPFLAEASSYTPYFLQQRPFYISEQGMYTADYYDRHKELVSYCEKAKGKGLISDREIRRVLDFLEGNARMISSGLELIDVKPWDAFLLPKDTVGLVDLEYATIVGRQYFDVAWSYMRFWADVHDQEAARAFLQSYMDHSVYDLRSFAPAFLTTLGMKVLGYLHDTADYMERFEKSGEQLPYSKEEMREVLDGYLKFNVEALV